jgi:hypothetical protein
VGFSCVFWFYLSLLTFTCFARVDVRRGWVGVRFFDVQRDVHVYVGLTGAFDDAVEFARAAISVRKLSSFLGCHSVHELQAVAKMVHQKRALLFSLRFHPALLEGYLLT